MTFECGNIFSEKRMREEGYSKVGKPIFETGESTILILRTLPVKRKIQRYKTSDGATGVTIDWTLLKSKIKNYALTKEELIKGFNNQEHELESTFQEVAK